MRSPSPGKDVLVSNWSPTLNVRYIFTTLHELLKTPNAERARRVPPSLFFFFYFRARDRPLIRAARRSHPLEPEIAQEYTSNKAEFEKKAKEMVDKHAR